jgi:hypothetical protein
MKSPDITPLYKIYLKPAQSPKDDKLGLSGLWGRRGRFEASEVSRVWVPAFAGMTRLGSFLNRG